jgi:hypothetical protein
MQRTSQQHDKKYSEKTFIFLLNFLFPSWLVNKKCFRHRSFSKKMMAYGMQYANAMVVFLKNPLARQNVTDWTGGQQPGVSSLSAAAQQRFEECDYKA